MPLFRYFIFVGGFLLCCFWALDHINGPAVSGERQQDTRQQDTRQQEMASLQAWRNTEARKEAAKGGRDASMAIVMPDIVPLPPTQERLAYERQLASNAVPAPVVASAETPRTVSEARAQMADNQPREKAFTQTVKPKAKKKPVVVVNQTPRQPQRNPEFAGFFFGRIFSN